MFEWNIKLQDCATSLVHGASNRRISALLDRVSAIDSVADFAALRDFVSYLKRDIIADGVPFGRGLIASESLFYGHLKALVEYAGRPYSEANRILLPYIEHGVAWLQTVPISLNQAYVHCAVSQGGYRKSAIHCERPWMPQYVVGPYIHYARPYYDAERTADLKSRLGKAMLVFPAHTYELSSVNYAKARFVDDVMERYSGEYDTILVSAYWHDADDEVFRLFEEAGAVVVSCGLREDPQFISRLRTVIEVSDAVSGNALGTHIGYAMCLGKPFLMEGGVEIKDDGSAYCSAEEAEMARIRESVGGAFREGENIERQKAAFDLYWGGKAAIKTPAEIECILRISEDVLEMTHGNTGKFPRAIEKILGDAERGVSTESAMRCALLREALEVKL